MDIMDKMDNYNRRTPPQQHLGRVYVKSPYRPYCPCRPYRPFIRALSPIIPFCGQSYRQGV